MPRSPNRPITCGFIPTSTPRQNSKAQINTVMTWESIGNCRRRNSHPTPMPLNMKATIVNMKNTSQSP